MSDDLKLIVHTSAMRIAGICLGIAVMIFTARWLGPEGRGVLSSVVSWAAALGVLFSISLGNVALHRVAQLEKSPSQKQLIYTLAVFWGGASLMAVCSIYIVDKWFSEVVFGKAFADYAIILIFFVPLTILEFLITPFLTAIGKLKLLNYRFLFSKGLVLILILILIGYYSGGIFVALWVFLIGQIVISTAGFRYLWKVFRKGGNNKLQLAPKMFKDGLRLHFTAIGAVLNELIDVILVSYFLGIYLTGIYHFALQFAALLLIIPQAVSMALNSRVANDGAERAWNIQRRIIGMVFIGEIVLGVFLISIAPTVIPLLVGDKFKMAMELIPWLVIAMIGKSFSLFMASQWVARGFFSLTSILTMSLGLLNLFANLVLIPLYGIQGAVWANVGVGFMSLLGNMLFLIYCEKERRQRLLTEWR